MAVWRMAFKAGSQGQDLWPLCRELGVAALTYPPIENDDLSSFSPDRLPSGWSELGPTPKFAARVIAWEMAPGDIIYVKDGPSIVGMGIVRGRYTFDPTDRIVDENGYTWKHQIPVRWATDFPAVRVKLGAELNAIKKLDEEEVRLIEDEVAKALHT